MSDKLECSEEGCSEVVFCKGLCRRDYYRQYQAANRQKKREAARKSYNKRYADPEYRERVQARNRQQYAAHRDERVIQQRERYANDAEYREAKKLRAKLWREANPERKKEIDRAYREANLGRLREYDAQPERMAKKAERKRERYEEIKLEGLLTYGDGSCTDCGYEPEDIFELEVHHVNHDGVDHRASITGMRRGGSFQFYRALKDAGWPTDVPLVTLCGRCHKKRTRAHQRSRRRAS